MSIINLKIQIPSDSNEEAIKGILLSILTGNIDILLKKRKGSYLNHFYFERLNRKEKRWVLNVLDQISKNLLPESKTQILEAVSAKKEETEIRGRYLTFFKHLQNS